MVIFNSSLKKKYNICSAFVSTEGLKDDPSKPFVFLMDLAMLGVGVGFDTKGADSVTVPGPNTSLSPITQVIADSREGWVEVRRLFLRSVINACSVT